MTSKIIQFSIMHLKKSIFPLLLLVLAISPLVILAIHNPTLLNTLVKNTDNNVLQLRILRWSIIITFIYIWPWVVTWIGNKAEANPNEIKRWKSERIRIGIWLILFELLVCENIISKLIHGI